MSAAAHRVRRGAAADLDGHRPAARTLDEPSGLISGTPATAGTFAVVVRATVTDAIGLTGDALFSWTIIPALQVATPGPQTGGSGGR